RRRHARLVSDWSSDVCSSDLHCLYLTKNTGVPYIPDAKFPQWDAFLEQAMGGNVAMRDFFQIVVGYSLQGSCREEKFVILHGPGATGKTTALESVGSASGEYHVAANFSTF